MFSVPDCDALFTKFVTISGKNAIVATTWSLNCPHPLDAPYAAKQAYKYVHFFGINS